MGSVWCKSYTFNIFTEGDFGKVANTESIDWSGFEAFAHDLSQTALALTWGNEKDSVPKSISDTDSLSSHLMLFKRQLRLETTSPISVLIWSTLQSD